MILAVFSLMLIGAPSPAADWSLGANLGVQLFRASERGSGEDGTFISIPAGNGAADRSMTPGLRIGLALGDRDELFSDVAFGHFNWEPASFSALQMNLNYQHAFGGANTSPYVTIGAGVIHYSSTIVFFGSRTSSDLSGVLGGGIGVRTKVSNGHGVIRAEVRVDHLSENNVLLFTNGFLFGVKLGFDLWMR